MKFPLFRLDGLRPLLLLTALFAFCNVAQAQRVNFKIKVTQTYEEVQASGKSVSKTEDVLSKLEIFTFGVENRARTAARRFNEGYVLKKGEGDCYDSKKVNARGEANNVQADTRGYAVLTMGLAAIDTAVVIPLEQHYDASTNTVNFSISVNGGKVLMSVNKSAKMKASGDKQGSARVYGNKVVVKGTIRLDSMYTREDARFVGSPRLVIVGGRHDGKDSVVHYFAPSVFDGLPYEKTQYRRMQFNAANDALNPYKINRNKEILKVDSMFMERRASYLFDYAQAYEPIDRSKRYQARMHRWYEDYNAVYYDDPDFLFWDGNFQDPLMFLDWGSARSMLEIDPREYSKEAKSEISEAKRSVKLEFEVGKTNLNMEDSVTVIEIDGLEQMLSKWFDDPDAEVRDVYVMGYASPEGSYATNVQLARGRSAYLVGQLKHLPGSFKVKKWHSNSDVVGWNEVADSLEFVIGTPEALEAAAGIRAITATTDNIDAQGRQIISQPWYPFVKDRALKLVRRVVIRCEYTATRILTPDEIYERYMTDEGYHNGTAEKDYEYYQLMMRLAEEERWDELKVISKAAYDNMEVTSELATRARRALNPEAKGEDDKYYLQEDRNNPYDRRYALAAYYLSSCKLRSEEADTTILGAYLDDYRHKVIKDPEKGQGFGIWNDPAIVVNHILMHCYAKNYSRAEYYALNWLPDNPADPNYQVCKNLRMFVSCLNGGFETDPEVREYIKSTSPMNHAVVAAAEDSEAGYKEALEILNDSSKVDMQDAKVHYLKAICRFRLQPLKDYEHPAYPSYNIYDPDPDDQPRDWAAPMLEAFRLNPEMEKQLMVDGYFNDAYRRLVRYFWHRLKAGASMQEICREYDVLRTKYASNTNK